MVPREVAPATSAVNNCHPTATAHHPRLRFNKPRPAANPTAAKSSAAIALTTITTPRASAHMAASPSCGVLVRALAPPMSQWPPRTIPSSPSTATRTATSSCNAVATRMTPGASPQHCAKRRPRSSAHPGPVGGGVPYGWRNDGPWGGPSCGGGGNDTLRYRPHNDRA